MNVTEVHRIIAKYRLFRQEQPYNILSQSSNDCKSGKWDIPADKYKEFLENIHNVLSKTPSKKMHFMEKPSDKYNMIKMDVDLRFKATEEEIRTRTNLTRRYGDEFIELLVTCIKEKIEEIIDIKESFNIYVHEKKQPKITDENTIKDGIHIVIPELVLNNVALYHLRNSIIENTDLQDLFKEIDNITEVKEAIDKRIIYPNAWYIYGCGKPEDYGDFYKITKTFKVVKKNDGLTLKKIGLSSKTLLENIMMFSNFDKKPNVEYLLTFDEKDLNESYISTTTEEKTFGKKDKLSIIHMY